MPPKKMGRPPSENPKAATLRVRIDDSTQTKLEVCSQELNISKSEVVRMGIDMVLDSLKK